MAKKSVQFKVDTKQFVAKMKAKLGRSQPDERDKRFMGAYVVNQIKKLSSKGISPIKGHPKRFPAYKGKYKEGIEKRHKRFKGKRLRPVNLRLSGDFMKSLKYRATKKGVLVGFFKPSEAAKEQGHRERANGQGFRPVIPQRGETFIPTIINKLVDIMRKGVERRLKR